MQALSYSCRIVRSLSPALPPAAATAVRAQRTPPGFYHYTS